MQAVCSTGLKGAALTTRPSRSVLAPRPAVRGSIVCKAEARPILATAAALPAFLAAHPALAVVDQRLAGEGTGKILGVDTVEFFPIIIVFGIVWAFYYASQKDLDSFGRGSGDDSGFGM